MYVTKDENTLANLHRFSIVYIDGKPWEVQATDPYSSDGIILVQLSEYYQNSIEKAVKEEKIAEDEELPNPDEGEVEDIIKIVGPTSVYPYEKYTYKIENVIGGIWTVSNTKVEILSQTENEVRISVTSARSGNFDLIYSIDEEEIARIPIKINSL